MIYELRTYTSLPYKWGALVEMFGKLMPVFERNGIRVIGVWTTYIGRLEEFIYLLEYESLADREEKRAKFHEDPDYAKIRQETDPVAQYHEYTILQPTAYSPLR